MKPWKFQVVAKAEAPQALEIVIYDVIAAGTDFFGDPLGISAEQVLEQLRSNTAAKSIALRLNTVGGVMDEATAIYNVLAERLAAGVELVCYIDGIAASAGAYLATVAPKVVMPANAMMMIHRARGGMRGTAADMEAARAALESYDGVIVDALAAASARRGKAKSKQDFVAEMAKGDRYIRADEAIAWGLADEKTTAVLKAVACAVDLSEFASAPAELLAEPFVVHAQIEPPPTEPPAPAPEPQPEPPAPQPAPTPVPPEKTTMTQPASDATPSIARALGLPMGATEADIVAAATRSRETELQIVAITGVQVTGEALGALRGIKAKADRCDAAELELVTVKAERDQQNFDALVMKGRSTPVKLTPATAKLYEDRFATAKAEGRGADIVAELKGFIDVAPTIHALSERRTPPQARAGAAGSVSSAATHNGKTYAEMKPLERARLKETDPELFNLMRQEAQASA